MIVKPSDLGAPPNDPRQRAGVEAERQMAFYLHRAFSTDSDLYVLNNLRLVDPQQPEINGRPDAGQIDHLVIHRWGAFIIESKSVAGQVSVRDDGSGGDEWTRDGAGMASPIQQARRQAEFLRSLLQRDRGSLLGKLPVGLRQLSVALNGTEHRSFGRMPIQLIVAISDRGRINRVNGWKEPTAPFATFVSKADLVADKVRDEHAKHKAASRPVFGNPQGDYGIWAMKPEEASAVADFLASRHQPAATTASKPPTAPPPRRETQHPPPIASPQPTGPACKQCGGSDLSARSGRYGPYWKCLACDANTAMPKVCSICAAHGEEVHIRKEGDTFYRCCQKCGIEERLWA